MKKPTFFIIGAPKCGTTSLAQWLSQHPHVFFSRVKEPDFFSTDDPPRAISTLKDYERLFRGADSTHAAVGEGSTHYLISNDAIPNILRYTHDSRFIVCVRNPVDMVQSLHEQFIVTGDEHVTDLATAWRLSDDRATGRAVSRWCRSAKRLDYARVCSLGSHLERLYRLVLPEKVHVIVLDDLRVRPRIEYRDVLRFLDLEDDGRSDFPVYNSAKELRYPAVRMMVTAVSKVKHAVGLDLHGLGILTKVNRLNVRTRPREVMPPAVRAELVEFFKPEIVKLSAMLNRNFSSWLKV